MSQKFGCSVCKSADKPLEKFISNLPVETSFHRVESQEVKCEFALQGVCCRLCANGPCRITPDSPRGVCGADADVMVGRNFLRSVAAGSGCYIHVVENTALNLKNTALAGGSLKGTATLQKLCDLFDIDGKDDKEKAIKLADVVLSDLYKPAYEKMTLVEKLVLPKRFEKWTELGILPGGAKSEVFSAVVTSSTNLNSDPVNMLLHCLRLGISTGIFGLTLTNLLNDIILGEPEIRPAAVGFGVIDPDYVNIMITGHQHSMIADLQEQITTDEVTKKAAAAGAKGVRIVGCTCVGQDLQLRGAHCSEFFCGHGGNNFTSEAILATGAIDAVLSEFNCTLPGIEPICESLQIKQFCLDTIAKKANATAVDFQFDKRKEATKNILNDIITNYKNRRGSITLNLLPDHGNNTTLTGLSEVSLKKFLGDTWQPLIDLIVKGQIKGIAAVVGCSSLNGEGHDVLTVNLTKELIAKDILEHGDI